MPSLPYEDTSLKPSLNVENLSNKNKYSQKGANQPRLNGSFSGGVTQSSRDQESQDESDLNSSRDEQIQYQNPNIGQTKQVQSKGQSTDDDDDFSQLENGQNTMEDQAKSIYGKRVGKQDAFAKQIYASVTQNSYGHQSKISQDSRSEISSEHSWRFTKPTQSRRKQLTYSKTGDKQEGNQSNNEIKQDMSQDFTDSDFRSFDEERKLQNTRQNKKKAKDIDKRTQISLGKQLGHQRAKRKRQNTQLRPQKQKRVRAKRHKVRQTNINSVNSLQTQNNNQTLSEQNLLQHNFQISENFKANKSIKDNQQLNKSTKSGSQNYLEVNINNVDSLDNRFPIRRRTTTPNSLQDLFNNNQKQYPLRQQKPKSYVEDSNNSQSTQKQVQEAQKRQTRNQVNKQDRKQIETPTNSELSNSDNHSDSDQVQSQNSDKVLNQVVNQSSQSLSRNKDTDLSQSQLKKIDNDTDQQSQSQNQKRQDKRYNQLVKQQSNRKIKSYLSQESQSQKQENSYEQSERQLSQSENDQEENDSKSNILESYVTLGQYEEGTTEYNFELMKKDSTLFYKKNIYAFQKVKDNTEQAKIHEGETFGNKEVSVKKNMVEVIAGSNYWFQVTGIHESANEVMVWFPDPDNVQRGYAQWIRKDSSRIWRGSNSMKLWRHLGKGCWQPKENKRKSSRKGKKKKTFKNTQERKSSDEEKDIDGQTDFASTKARTSEYINDKDLENEENELLDINQTPQVIEQPYNHEVNKSQNEQEDTLNQQYVLQDQDPKMNTYTNNESSLEMQAQIEEQQEQVLGHKFNIQVKEVPIRKHFSIDGGQLQHNKTSQANKGDQSTQVFDGFSQSQFKHNQKDRIQEIKSNNTYEQFDEQYKWLQLDNWFKQHFQSLKDRDLSLNQKFKNDKRWIKKFTQINYYVGIFRDLNKNYSFQSGLKAESGIYPFQDPLQIDAQLQSGLQNIGYKQTNTIGSVWKNYYQNDLKQRCQHFLCDSTHQWKQLDKQVDNNCNDQVLYDFSEQVDLEWPIFQFNTISRALLHSQKSLEYKNFYNFFASKLQTKNSKQVKYLDQQSKIEKLQGQCMEDFNDALQKPQQSNKIQVELDYINQKQDSIKVGDVDNQFLEQIRNQGHLNDIETLNNNDSYRADQIQSVSIKFNDQNLSPKPQKSVKRRTLNKNGNSTSNKGQVIQSHNILQQQKDTDYKSGQKKQKKRTSQKQNTYEQFEKMDLDQSILEKDLGAIEYVPGIQSEDDQQLQKGNEKPPCTCKDSTHHLCNTNIQERKFGPLFNGMFSDHKNFSKQQIYEQVNKSRQPSEKDLIQELATKNDELGGIQKQEKDANMEFGNKANDIGQSGHNKQVKKSRLRKKEIQHQRMLKENDIEIKNYSHEKDNQGRFSLQGQNLDTQFIQSTQDEDQQISRQIIQKNNQNFDKLEGHTLNLYSQSYPNDTANINDQYQVSQSKRSEDRKYNQNLQQDKQEIKQTAKSQKVQKMQQVQKEAIYKQISTDIKSGLPYSSQSQIKNQLLAGKKTVDKQAEQNQQNKRQEVQQSLGNRKTSDFGSNFHRHDTISQKQDERHVSQGIDSNQGLGSKSQNKSVEQQIHNAHERKLNDIFSTPTAQRSMKLNKQQSQDQVLTFSKFLPNFNDDSLNNDIQNQKSVHLNTQPYQKFNGNRLQPSESAKDGREVQGNMSNERQLQKSKEKFQKDNTTSSNLQYTSPQTISIDIQQRRELDNNNRQRQQTSIRNGSKAVTVSKQERNSNPQNERQDDFLQNSTTVDNTQFTLTPQKQVAKPSNQYKQNRASMKSPATPQLSAAKKQKVRNEVKNLPSNMQQNLNSSSKLQQKAPQQINRPQKHMGLQKSNQLGQVGVHKVQGQSLNKQKGTQQKQVYQSQSNNNTHNRQAQITQHKSTTLEDNDIFQEFK